MPAGLPQVTHTHFSIQLKGIPSKTATNTHFIHPGCSWIFITGTTVSTSRAYLMSSSESRVPVHVVLGLAHIDHLVGVELEHALHPQLTVALLRLVRGALGHSLLLQLLPSSLALPYPSQIPESPSRSTTMRDSG